MRADGVRAQSVARTVTTIVDAARGVLSDPAPTAWSMEAVALEAGVTRATVYNHFAAKTDLIEAVLDVVVARDRMDRLVEVADGLDPVAGLQRAVSQTCRFWHAERPLLRRLFAAAYADRAVDELLQRREGWRRDQLATMLSRVGKRSGVDPRRYTDVLLALTSFPAYDRLVGPHGRPRTAAAALNRVVAQLLSS
ncbi:MAG: hypothetical protein QOG49_240 [Frankiaceae bacterium]|nr:hypothetical protein [Frankiaceae bacterium]